jgi:hypothetical protein
VTFFVSASFEAKGLQIITPHGVIYSMRQLYERFWSEKIEKIEKLEQLEGFQAATEE